MLRRQQIASLSILVDELSTIEGWPDVRVNAALLMWDVLIALDLPDEQRSRILGHDVELYVTDHLASRYYRTVGT
jgi:hypothetical protein